MMGEEEIDGDVLYFSSDLARRKIKQRLLTG